MKPENTSASDAAIQKGQEHDSYSWPNDVNLKEQPTFNVLLDLDSATAKHSRVLYLWFGFFYQGKKASKRKKEENYTSRSLAAPSHWESKETKRKAEARHFVFDKYIWPL